MVEIVKVMGVMCITTVELMILQVVGRERLFISWEGCTGLQTSS